SGERIVQILDVKAENKGGDLTLETIESLEFQGVSFQYEPGEENRVIEDVSFSVKKGESLAILGPTGSGKTSLMNLIVGFYEHTGGNILINGRDIKSYTIESIRSRIALVTQDPYLFSGTIRENILPAAISGSCPTSGAISGSCPTSGAISGSCPTSGAVSGSCPTSGAVSGSCPNRGNDAWIEKILMQSHADSVVSNFPGGVDMMISQGGASLSSGERQLISIARAFAHEPDMIIFDEATSYVDTESEEQIRIAAAKLKENRTSITIAHRLRSAMTADKIIILKDGRIIERGDHPSLMEKRGFYYRLHNS
ncbi:MAG: ABC transporter ATP-binding protein, partial [Desulfamplus sp.]|nr:ABC transporter ATP-binding protein [Desulfamplus sp.]